ncbi:uncharacterized protein BP01DRAFT_85104 [Aspergillus saccharolyticus JOP 1030-1]|uniref:Protein ZIP4 homolog n=1 Tax=Aspergillus saccharolyticus JOP 1030-1 TaxID=1450539 RepID=A0A319ABA9_9EURO|nr:hypothetical protein BP01DRAFT_85104 [Aspergillus saccharolyticus JOP 1030-1]PYH44222.1 hypothetical protein BP01DRAFT_85104 [Aspergillus saccharolyticus JOP 1030-1]
MALSSNTAGEDILLFASEIQKRLQTDTCDAQVLYLDETTSLKLNSYLDQLPISTGASPPSHRRCLDNKGTELWNTCTRRLANDSDPATSGLLCKVKAFAWAMLDAAASSKSSGIFRVLETAYKLSKTCIEHELITISLKVIEAVAMRLDALEHLETEVDGARLRQCHVQYYMLRVHLAWLQGRPDIADHLYLKIPDTNTGDYCVLDVCYKVGSAALSGSYYALAAKWLGRGLKQCNLLASAVEGVDMALRDKRLLLLHALVRTNLHLDTHESQANLARLLHDLRVVSRSML